MRKVLSVAAVCLLFPASALGRPLVPEQTKDQMAFGAVALGFQAEPEGLSTSVKVNGYIRHCPRLHPSIYRCWLRVHYRILDGTGQPWESCRAQIRANRHWFRFPVTKTTCPDEWLP